MTSITSNMYLDDIEYYPEPQVISMDSRRKYTYADNKTNICKVTEARWEALGDGRWVFIITADRFLRNMVRAIVGTLVEVGRGKLTIEQLRQVIEAKDRCRAGDSVPGNALFLVEVLY